MPGATAWSTHRDVPGPPHGHEPGLVGLQVAGVCIENPQCTEKTYPDFFQDLESLRHAGRLAPE